GSKVVEQPHSYWGFDRNDYPGDAAMVKLRQQFVFTGYWLTPPPEEKTNSWSGKRKVLEVQGYGFLLLTRGRALDRVRTPLIAKQAGAADAREAIRRAKTEGFADGAIIYLDVEDGGRFPAAYHEYLKSWADGVVKEGFRPGVYCSGIPVDEG